MATIRPYNPETDNDAIWRIWVEIGWLEPSDSVDGIAWTFADGQAFVGEVNGTPEVSINAVPGTIRHGTTDVPLSTITALTASRVARRQRVGSALVGRSVADARARGALASSLGIFDQGYYDKFGFGTGPYENSSAFDPASLTLPPPDRDPRRLTPDDAQEMLAAMQRRMLPHGQVRLEYPGEVRAGMAWEAASSAFGFETDGVLTHFFYGKMEGEFGPLVVFDLVYENAEQLLELLGFIAGFADQTTAVRLSNDPSVIVLHDFIERPFRHRQVTSGSTTPLQTTSRQWWQIRLNDVAAALSVLETEHELTFGLAVTDPIEPYLPADSSWTGESGTYVVDLGPTTTCRADDTGDLPTVTCSINALTRWWLGVASASTLAASDDFAGPPELLAELDRAVRLPTPHAGAVF